MPIPCNWQCDMTPVVATLFFLHTLSLVIALRWGEEGPQQKIAQNALATPHTPDNI